MNDNNYSDYNEDMEIDLLDMVFYLMKKWRGLLLALVIGAVMGVGLYIVKNHQQQTEQEAKAAELLKSDESEEFDEKDYKISKDTKVNMDIAYQYHQLYNKQLEYNQKSIIMQLDPNAVYAGELKYYISAGNNTGLLSVLYQNILNDEEALEELKEASGFKCDTQYIKELLSSWTADENEASINITSSQDTDSVTTVAKHSFVTYRVISTSQKSCEKMLKVIRTKADELQSECEETYGSYSIIEVGNDISQVTDNTYLNMQRTNVDRLNDCLNTMKNAESNFTDKEKTYYNKKYLAKEYAEKADTEEGKDLLLSETDVEPVSKVKWLMVGIFLMCIVWGGFYAVRYLFDKRIKTLSELRETYHLPIIGYMDDKKVTSKGIDKWIDGLYRKMKDQPNTTEYVENALNSMEQYELCGNVELAQTLKLGNNCFVGKNFVYRDSETLNKAKEIGSIILMIQIGKTTRGEIERELECCKLQKINVIGTVAVDA